MRVLTSLMLICLASLTIATDEHVDVANGNNQFAKDLYNVLSQRQGNVLFSPISAHAVLSMVWQGAQGTTDEALTKTLHLTDHEVAAAGYNRIQNNLNNVENVTLLVANKVYVQEGANLVPEFNNAVTENFGADVQQLNFANTAESAQIINRWVEQQTKNKIKDIVDGKSLDPATSLMLVNAIYFKGDWMRIFDEKLTKKGPFYLNDQDTVDVDMMSMRSSFRHKTDNELNAEILEMRYKNQEFSLVIILPKERNGIKEVEEKLKNVDWSKITEDLHWREFDLFLPKFKFETTIDMKESLTKLGLGEIFDQSKANFTGMVENGNLVVDKVIQKAFIEVNERGTEAAAGTTISLIPVSMARQFIVDHPFIFIIKGQGNPLFVGRVSKF